MRYPKNVDGLVVIVDVDGTIMEPAMGTPRVPYGDAAALERQKPNQRLVHRLQSLQDSGFVLRIVSGRSEALRDVTQRQLEAAGLDGVELVLQEEWRGVDELRRFKAQQHIESRAVLSIGDCHVDLDAAVDAGTPFLSDVDFQAGESLDYLFCWECGCTALRACHLGCYWATGRQCSRCAAGENEQIEAYVEVEHRG